MANRPQRSALTNRSGLLAKLGTISILYVAVFLTRIGFGTIIVLFPIYLGTGSSVLAGGITALYPAVEGLSALPIGAYVDFRGRRRIFITGLAMISLLTFIIGLSNNLFLVGGAHAIEGLAAGMVTIASLTMITDLTVQGNRGAGMGGFDLSNLSGYGVGILLGLSFSNLFASNLGLSFLVVSGIMGGSAIVVYFILREPPHISQGAKKLREVYNSLTGDVVGILPIWFSLTVILGYYLFLPRLVKNAGVAVADLSQSAGLILIALLVLGSGAVLFGRLSDKIGRTKTVLIGAVGEISFLAVLPTLFDKLVVIPPNTPWVQSYNMVGPILIVGGIFFFFGSAIIPSILAYIGDKVSHNFRGSAMGLYSLMLSGGIATGTVLAGVFDELGGVVAVFYSAAIIFSGLALTSGFLLYRNNKIKVSILPVPREAGKPM